ncbi:MAG: electron transport complex subunit RsxC [Ruminococcaceae bacterium]|nr:electron transport complex subunit RsxC [Oscillospiraceae bacterium]
MGVLTFKGGIHPDDKKIYTKDKPIVEMSASKEMVYPMSQHIGAPCEPIVNVGDTVCVGQKIADSSAFVSAPIHSTVSGTVTKIEKRRHPNGQMVNSVIIENDDLYTLSPDIYRRDGFENLSKEEKLAIIREAGLVGLGGAGFPTHIKLNPSGKIDCVIINAAECEPYLTSDYRVMMETAFMVVEGLRFIMNIVECDKGYIAIENNKMEAIKKMKEASSKYDNIDVVTLKTKYPQGSEKHLIYAVTKREVPSGKLPADVGVVVQNVDSACAVYNAAIFRQPVLSRVVTVSGGAIDSPCNFRVKLGTSFTDVIENAGGFIGNVKKIVMGGPMMGIAQQDTDTPVIKTTSAILAFDESEIYKKEKSPCLRCGKCVNSCPMNLVPLTLAESALNEDFSKCLKYNILDCIECGICSYVCPSERSCTQAIKIGKQKINALKKKQGGK